MGRTTLEDRVNARIAVTAQARVKVFKSEPEQLLFFLDSAQDTYIYYQYTLPVMPGGQPVQLGDEAYVLSQGQVYLAAMRYRNVFLDIQLPYKPETIRTGLTDDKLIAILKDIYEKILRQ